MFEQLIAKNVIRIVSGVVIIGAITALTGTVVPVASKHKDPPTSQCAVTATAVGAALVVTGSGFAPSAQYLLFLSSPGGNGETTANTDATGSFTYSTWAYWSGTYGAAVYMEGHGSALVATCTSMTVS